MVKRGSQNSAVQADIVPLQEPVTSSAAASEGKLKSQLSKLTERQRAILAIIEHRALVAPGLIAKWTGYKQHIIRYEISRLIEEGVLGNKQICINRYALGYLHHKFLCASSNAGTKYINLEGFGKCNLSSICDFESLHGEYTVRFSVFSKSPLWITKLLNEMIGSESSGLERKVSVMNTEFHSFGRRYINSKFAGPTLSWSYPRVVEKLDPLDVKIVQAALSKPFLSIRELSRALDEPQASVNRHIHTLEESKVIIGYTYKINPRVLGLSKHVLFISTRGTHQAVTNEMIKICEAESRIVSLAKCIGSWDYELEVEVDNAAEISSIIQVIGERAGKWVTGVKSAAIST